MRTEGRRLRATVLPTKPGAIEREKEGHLSLTPQHHHFVELTHKRTTYTHRNLMDLINYILLNPQTNSDTVRIVPTHTFISTFFVALANYRGPKILKFKLHFDSTTPNNPKSHKSVCHDACVCGYTIRKSPPATTSHHQTMPPPSRSFINFEPR